MAHQPFRFIVFLHADGDCDIEMLVFKVQGHFFHGIAEIVHDLAGFIQIQIREEEAEFLTAPAGGREALP